MLATFHWSPDSPDSPDSPGPIMKSNRDVLVVATISKRSLNFPQRIMAELFPLSEFFLTTVAKCLFLGDFSQMLKGL